MREQAALIFQEQPATLQFESMRLFMLMEATQWSHLPVSGGWYNQHPLFVDEITMIFNVRAEVDARKRLQESRQNAGPGYGPPGNL